MWGAQLSMIVVSPAQGLTTPENCKGEVFPRADAYNFSCRRGDKEVTTQDLVPENVSSDLEGRSRAQVPEEPQGSTQGMVFAYARSNMFPNPVCILACQYSTLSLS